MPYAMRKIRGQNAYKVFNKLTGKIHSNHTTLANAKKQLNLLERLAKDEELQIAIDNDKTIVRAKKGEKDKEDKLTKIKKNLKEILGEGILDLALGDRTRGNNPNTSSYQYGRQYDETGADWRPRFYSGTLDDHIERAKRKNKENEREYQKEIIANNLQIVNLPFENEFIYQAPPFVIATNKKKSGYNFKLVNPMSKERNLASRKGENVIGLDRRAIPVPAIFHRDKEGRLQRPELRDFSPEDREILKKYNDLIERYEEQFNEGDFEEIPEIPFSNAERGRPCKLPKNCGKAIKRGKQGRLDITELTPTAEDIRRKNPLEPTTPYVRTTATKRHPQQRRSSFQELQPEMYEANQRRLAKKKKPIAEEEEEPDYPMEADDYPLEEADEEEAEAKRTLEDFGIRLNNNTISKDILAPLIDYIKQGDFEDWDKLDAYIALIRKRKIKTPVGFKELTNLAKKKGSGLSKKNISSNSIMPKFAKGSKEAKEYMASLRANRGAKVAKPVSSKIGGGFINYLPASSNSQSQISNAYNDSELGANGGKNYISL